MKLFRSLTNRIFFASALLAVSAISIAIFYVNRGVGSQAEQELQRGLGEAGILIEEYRRVLVEHFTREARLVADLPRLKAAVYERDPNTIRPVVEEYRQQLKADLLLLTSKDGDLLAELMSPEVGPTTTFASMPGVAAAAEGQESSFFWPQNNGVLQVVSVPVFIDESGQREFFGALSVGFSLDSAAAARFKRLTNSDIAFGMDGAIRASTLPASDWPQLAPLLARDGLWTHVPVGGQEYIAKTHELSPAPPGSDGTRAQTPATGRAHAVILRSRTERLSFLNPLHRQLAVIAFVAVLAATILSYAIARTVTRPLGAITATMREMAATGDLTRRIPPSAGAMWDDEDARLLATTFNSMTDSIARFQRDAAQRERLLALGRLSTVVAHEIRNPLMIIRTALRPLRGPAPTPEEVRAAAADIDEETARLNRIVSEVLDFARPIKFELAPANLNALCEDAARAAAGQEPDAVAIRLDLDPRVGAITTDAERLRLALVNVVTNARHAVAARDGARSVKDPIRLRTRRVSDTRVAIEVADQGTGIAAEDLTRIFDPYFTTRRTGTGLGLAISRNIVEGLGGTITMTSRTGAGSEVRIELPTRSE